MSVRRKVVPAREAPRLPPEMLEKVFCLLEDPQDIASAMLTCVEWRDCIRSDDVIIYQLIFPLLVKYLPPKTVLACRLVCSQLKRTIDRVLERALESSKISESFQRQWFYRTYAPASIIRLLRKSYMFSNLRSIVIPPPRQGQGHRNRIFNIDGDGGFENFQGPRGQMRIGEAVLVMNTETFINKFGNDHGGNLFIGRTIFFKFTGGDGLEAALSLLDYERGSHVSSFTHILTNCQERVEPGNVLVPLKYFQELPAILARLSNLKALVIDWKSSMVQTDKVHGNWDTEKPTPVPICPDDYPYVLKTIAFPPVSNLNTLNYSYNEGYSVSFAVCLLSAYGSQITTLICPGEVWNLLEPIMIDSLLPSLKNLRVVGVTTASLIKLSRISFQLEQLQLVQKFGENWDGNELVKTMNYFSESLTKLELDTEFSFVSQFWEVKKPMPLYKLKHLSTKASNLGSSLFLQLIELKCPCVEVLDVLSPGNSRSHGKMPFSRDNLKIKKLFSVVPKLKKIRFGFDDSKVGTVLYR